MVENQMSPRDSGPEANLWETIIQINEILVDFEFGAKLVA